jgi:hypothetical protein
MLTREKIIFPINFYNYPLFTQFSSFLKIFDPSFNSLKILASIIFSLIPLIIFPLAYKLSNSKICGLATILIIGFNSTLFKILWVADYSLLLGILLYFSSFNIVYKTIERKKILITIIGIIISFLISFSHLTVSITLLLVTLSIIIIDILFSKKINMHLILIFFSNILSAILSFKLFSSTNVFMDVTSQATWSEIDFWNIDYAILILLITSAIIGIYYLYKCLKKEIFIISIIATLIPIILSLLSLEIFKISYILSIPMLMIFSSIPIKFLRRSASFKRILDKKNEESIIEINIQFDKLMPAIICIIFLFSSINNGLSTSEKEYFKNIIFTESKLKELFNILDWIKNNIPENSTIACNSSLSNWIESYSKKSTILKYGIEGILAFEALQSTNFRIITPYLKIDEMQPISQINSPKISSFNGEKYEDLLYIDDSLTELYLKDKMFGIKIKEKLDKLYLRNYEWFKNSNEINLKLFFEKENLYINKTIKTELNESNIEIIYEFKTDSPNLNIEKASITIFIAPEKNITSYSYNEKIFLLEISNEKVEIEIYGENKRMEIIKPIKNENERIKIDFEKETNKLEFKIKMKFLTAKKSNFEPWIGSAKELIKKFNIDYLIVPKISGNFLKNFQYKKYDALYIDDSLTNIEYEINGVKQIEKIEKSKMINERIFNMNECKILETIYETENMYINQTIKIFNEKIINVTYSIEAKNNVNLTMAELNICIPWNNLRNTYVDYPIFTFKLFSGNITVKPGRNIKQIDFEPTEREEHVLKMIFKLKNGKGEISTSLECSRPIKIYYSREKNKFYICYYEEGLLTLINEFENLQIYKTIPEKEKTSFIQIG